MSELPNKTQTDIYDEEFFNNLQIAKPLVQLMGLKRDKEICKKWIQKLCNLKSDDPIVKKNRNAFFKYMLRIIHKAAQKEAENPAFDPTSEQKIENEFTSKWSSDNRTYIAAKPLPGEGAMIYMAVASDPKLGWDHP
ncbi:uncharacterized protein LOC130896786 isoform X2 [Diorhabda carinulata]|nr:uncharacterized protein LOC130449408 [Diorhabda sublineata]XP_057661083.1 uncharacterized protein LOC130896786 isoform X2 [Diorhabda carinulata]